MPADIYLKIEGLKGECEVAGHIGEIEILSWSFGVSNTASSIGTGKGGGKSSFSDMNFVAYMDSAGPGLMQACATGKHYTKAKLVQRKAGGEQLEFIDMDLEEVYITNVNISASDQVMVTFNMCYSKIKIDYQPQDAQGKKKGGAIPGSYNLAQVKK